MCPCTQVVAGAYCVAAQIMEKKGETENAEKLYLFCLDLLYRFSKETPPSRIKPNDEMRFHHSIVPQKKRVCAE